MTSEGPLAAPGTVIHLRPPSGMENRWAIAQQRFEVGDLKTALDLFESIASDGYVEAYVEVGNIYEIGKGGVSCDFSQAEAWYRKGIASMDDPHSHLGLGRLYFNGTGVLRDYENAFQHLLKAESTQNPQALLMLGVLYQLGRGTSVDLNRAHSLYTAAAANELVLAMQFLTKLEFGRK